MRKDLGYSSSRLAMDAFGKAEMFVGGKGVFSKAAVESCSERRSSRERESRADEPGDLNHKMEGCMGNSSSRYRCRTSRWI